MPLTPLEPQEAQQQPAFKLTPLEPTKPTGFKLTPLAAPEPGVPRPSPRPTQIPEQPAPPEPSFGTKGLQALEATRLRPLPPPAPVAEPAAPTPKRDLTAEAMANIQRATGTEPSVGVGPAALNRTLELYTNLTRTLGMDELAAGFQNRIEALRYEPQFDAAEIEELWRGGQKLEATKKVLEAVPEKFAESIPDMVGVLALPLLPAYLTARMEELSQTRAQTKGKEFAGIQERLEVLPAVLGSAALDRFAGLKNISAGSETVEALGYQTLQEIAKQTGIETLKGVGREALTEAIQENLELKAETLGTGAEPGIVDEAMRSAWGAVFGAALGGGVAGVATPINIELQNKQLDQQVREWRAARAAGTQADPEPLYDDPRADPLSEQFVGPLQNPEFTERLKQQNAWAEMQLSILGREIEPPIDLEAETGLAGLQARSQGPAYNYFVRWPEEQITQDLSQASNVEITPNLKPGVYGKTINPRFKVDYAKAKTFLTRLSKIFDPEGVFVLTDPGELPIGNTTSAAIFNHVATDSRKRYYQINFDPALIKRRAKRFEISYEAALHNSIAHEFGHYIFFEKFLTASKAGKRALLNDYRRWLRRKATGEIPAEQFWSEIIAPSRGDIIGPVAMARLEAGFTPEKVDYWHSFREFMAEQMVRYVGREVRGLPTPSIPLFQEVAQELDRVHKKLEQASPGFRRAFPGVDNFLDSLRFRSMLHYMEKERPDPSDAVSDDPVRTAKLVEKGIQKLGLPEPVAEAWREATSHLPRFNWFMKWALTLPQVERENAGIPGVQRFTEGIRRWWAESGNWKDRANQTLNFARGLENNKTQLKAFEKFVFEVTKQSEDKQRRLRPEELASVANRFGLQELGQRVYGRMDQDFQLALRQLFQVLRDDVQRSSLQNDPLALEKRLAELAKEQQVLLNRNYFPLSRFGRFGVKVKAKQAVRVDGRDFKTGEVVWFSLDENSRDRENTFKRIKQKYGDAQRFEISRLKTSDEDRMYQNMPRALLEKIEELAVSEYIATRTDEEGNPPSDEDVRAFRVGLNAKIENARLDAAPGESYRKRLKERKLTPGFSEDALRSYASYMSSYSSFIARIKNAYEILGGLEDVRTFATHMGRTGDAAASNKAADLRDSFGQHYQYLMNPGNEWAGLRSFGALWYLSNLKSAFVNLTQVPLATEAFLEQRFGFGPTIKELKRSITSLRQAFLRGQGNYEADLVEAIDWGYASQFLNESLATELGAYADGNTISRALPSTRVGIRKGFQAFLFPFQFAEKLNRMITFTASYRLQRDKLLKGRSLDDLEVEEADRLKKQAREFARESIEVTQGEYARWARPKVMQGPRSALFLFKLYMQHMTYILARDPSRWRFLRNAFILGGALGIPFAEDLMDIAEGLWKQVKDQDGGPNEYVDLQGELRKFAVGQTAELKKLIPGDMMWLSEMLNGAPDLFLHGLGRYGLGVMPLADLSTSLSLGKIVPGVELTTRQAGTFEDPYAGVGRFAEAVGGPLAGIAISVYKAAASKNPDEWKRWEAAFPPLIAGISKAARFATRGEETGYGREQILEFDTQDTAHMLEIVGQALGFRPRRLAQAQEERWEKIQAEKFYSGRRAVLMQSFYDMYVTGDREGKKDVIEAIKRYNREKPKEAPGISSQDLGRSLKQRLRRKRLKELGLPASKSYAPLYRATEESFPSSLEERSP